MVKIPPLIAALLLALLFQGSAHAGEVAADASVSAETDPDAIIIEGDRMEVYLDRKMRSIGNAMLHRNGQDIYGDAIEYDVLNDELHVVGNTRIDFEGTTVWGSELRMQLEDQIGEMKDPSFRLDTQLATPGIGAVRATDFVGGPKPGTIPQLATERLTEPTVIQPAPYQPTIKNQLNASRGDAETIFFEGQNKKRLIDARYTTCEADVDDWYIKASELELDDHSKTATATNARVEFKGVPILYTPWINFSYLNQRKSGILAPNWGTTTRSGFELTVPYYWNIAPDMDATLGLRFLSKRGTQYQGEFRYLGETYSGTSNLEYLSDDNQNGENRYYANLKHIQTFGNGWSAGYNYEKVSDNEYFSELDTHITATSRVNLLQQGFVNYAMDNQEIGAWSFNGLVQKFQTLDDVSFPYERLPQLTLSGSKDWENVSGNLYSQWVSFDRDKSAPVVLSTTMGGRVETEVTGSRLTTYPSVSFPFAQPYGYVTPKFGVHYTSYDLDTDSFREFDGNGNLVNTGIYNSENRSLPIFSVDSGLFFDRDFRVVKNRYTQTLEPRLFYVYIPYKDQSDLPIFDTALADLNMGTLFLENQFVGNDRVNDANQLSLAVTTRMIDQKTGIQRLAATIGQRFYFDDQRVTLPGMEPRDSNTSEIVTAVTARLRNNWNVDLAWLYNTDSERTTRSNIGARYNPAPGKTFNISYRYFEERLEQIDVSGQWPLAPQWYGVGRWNYSLRENQPIEGLAGVEYNAGCWQARAVMQRVSTLAANANYAFFFQLELGGIASIGSNPLRLLERSIPGYMSSNVIPAFEPQPYE
jgi:LPS-assembly protein